MTNRVPEQYENQRVGVQLPRFKPRPRRRVRGL